MSFFFGGGGGWRKRERKGQPMEKIGGESVLDPYKSNSLYMIKIK